MSDDLYERFSGEDVRATLNGRWGRCRIDIAIEAEGQLPESVELEVLCQPRDTRQLPLGPPLLLHKQRLQLRATRPGRRLIGSCNLPSSIKPQLARSCYYRLAGPPAPVTDGTATMCWTQAAAAA